MAIVKLGPIVEENGKILTNPIMVRSFYLWVHWDKDPGTAFDVNDIEFVNEAGSDQSSRIRSVTPIGRRGNSFLFRYSMSGIEDTLKFQIPANTFDNNEEVELILYIVSYPPALGGWVIPTTTVTSSTMTATVNVIRPRPHMISDQAFTLTGIVNGLPYESKEAITSFSPTSTSTRNEVVTLNVKLPHNSKGILRLRVDANTVRIIYRPDATANNLYPPLGPISDRYSQSFTFDTTGSSSLTIERGMEGTVAASHSNNAKITHIDHVLDIRDNPWVVKPINELDWRLDLNSFRNQITINPAEGPPYSDEDRQSVAEYGGKREEIDVPLGLGQRDWLKWIADTFLETHAQPKYIATLKLVSSFYLKLGDIIYLREKDNKANVVQVVQVSSNYDSKTTDIQVRQIGS